MMNRNPHLLNVFSQNTDSFQKLRVKTEPGVLNMSPITVKPEGLAQNSLQPISLPVKKETTNVPSAKGGYIMPRKDDRKRAIFKFSTDINFENMEKPICLSKGLKSANEKTEDEEENDEDLTETKKSKEEKKNPEEELEMQQWFLYDANQKHVFDVSQQDNINPSNQTANRPQHANVTPNTNAPANTVGESCYFVLTRKPCTSGFNIAICPISAWFLCRPSLKKDRSNISLEEAERRQKLRTKESMDLLQKYMKIEQVAGESEKASEAEQKINLKRKFKDMTWDHEEVYSDNEDDIDMPDDHEMEELDDSGKKMKDLLKGKKPKEEKEKEKEPKKKSAKMLKLEQEESAADLKAKLSSITAPRSTSPTPSASTTSSSAAIKVQTNLKLEEEIRKFLQDSGPIKAHRVFSTFKTRCTQAELLTIIRNIGTFDTQTKIIRLKN